MSESVRRIESQEAETPSTFRIVPHSAEPERVFSFKGWYHSEVRNRLSYQATTDMTKIKFLRQFRL
jgi:hypothetical protein